MKTLYLLTATLLFAACTVDESEETVGKQIADDYNAALDKARDVENQVLEQKKKLDEALEDAEKSIQDP